MSGPIELGHCCHVVVGPSGHGVVRAALRLARAAGSLLVHLAAPDLAVVLPASTRVVHLHVTDKLFGRTPAEAAAACARLVRRLDAPVVIGLHDVPLGDADDVAKGRVEAYRSFASMADVLVVASAAEARRLRGFAADADAVVLPLPVPAGRPHRRSGTDQRLGVLGFVYPGKGHPTVIDAAGTVGADVVAVGACSPGHDDLGPSLRERAAQRGIELEITGAVPSARFVAQATTIAVPVVPSTRPAASASLMSWIGAGRRPLVAANEHTVEVAERLGAHLQLFDGTVESLADAAAAALAEPAVTWSHRPIPHHATLPGMVERFGQLLAHVHERGRVSALGDGTHWWVPGNQWDLVADRVRLPAATRLAVIIPYFEQPESLLRMYAALTVAVVEARREVVVVDDGSRHAPPPPPADLGVPVRVLRQEDRGVRPAAARHTGVAATDAELLVFLDPDTLPAPATIARLAAWPATIPDGLVVGLRHHVDLDGWDASRARLV